MPISRVLSVNRGEIAARVVRAAHALGIETVQAVSMADRESRAAQLADRTVVIGPAASMSVKVEAGVIASRKSVASRYSSVPPATQESASIAS